MLLFTLTTLEFWKVFFVIWVISGAVILSGIFLYEALINKERLPNFVQFVVCVCGWPVVLAKFLDQFRA